jgi:hypothetical protein
MSPPVRLTLTTEELSQFWHVVNQQMPPIVHATVATHYQACAFHYRFRDGLHVEAACRKAWGNVGFEPMECASCTKVFPSELGQIFCSTHCWNKMKGVGCGEACDECENYGCVGAEDEEEALRVYRQAFSDARAAFYNLVTWIEDGRPSLEEGAPIAEA